MRVVVAVISEAFDRFAVSTDLVMEVMRDAVIDGIEGEEKLGGTERSREREKESANRQLKSHQRKKK